MNEQPGAENRIWMAIALSIAVMFIWGALFPPPAPQVPPGDAVTDGAQPDPDTPMPGTQPDPVPNEPQGQGAPTVVDIPDVPKNKVELEHADYEGTITWDGGAISRLNLTEYGKAWNVTTLWGFVADLVLGRSEGWQPYQRPDGGVNLLSHDGSLVIAGKGRPSADGEYNVVRNGAQVVAARTTPEGLQITKTYTPGSGDHVLDVEVRFENRSQITLDSLWVGVAEEMTEQGGRFANIMQPLAHGKGGLEKLDDPEDAAAPQIIEGPINWVGYGDRYFLAVLLPRDSTGANAEFEPLDDGRIGSFFLDKNPLSPGEVRTHAFAAYVGPKDLSLLRPLGAELDDAVEFGFFGILSKPLLTMLKMFEKAVGNWGIAIILLTVLVKLLFFPLTQKAYVSSKRMQAINPQLQEIREKYKDNPQLQTQETMKLFSEHKVNPMGGCLPSIVQIPVWFALYSVLLNSVELYNSTFLYIQDLTEVDPFGVLPTLVAVLMFLQQRMMPMTGMDPTQQKIMRMMPLFFAFIMYTLPAGLSLYITINTSLGIIQQWHINRSFKTNEEPAMA